MMLPLPLPRAPIELVAIDPARNIRRRYRIAASHDLFGHIVIEAGWGRIGAGGQTRMRSFTDEIEAARHVAALLRQRARAPSRIGVGYAVVRA